MITFHDLDLGLRSLNINPNSPVIIHASLSSFGEIQGGAETLLGAVTRCFHSVMVPAFTYKTMVVPLTGPDHNGIKYGSGESDNQLADFFIADETPADKSMGVIAEKLRTHPEAIRSTHPILSFSGIHVNNALQNQTLQQPLAPIQQLSEQQGWGLLLGVDQTANTTLHLAEQLSGRKQFIRWALTPEGTIECPAFPGCSEGFNAIQPYLQGILRQVNIGKAVVTAFPLKQLLDITLELLRVKPLALLCSSQRCDRCNAVRQSLIR